MMKFESRVGSDCINKLVINIIQLHPRGYDAIVLILVPVRCSNSRKKMHTKTVQHRRINHGS